MESEFTINDYWQVIQRRLWIIVLCVIAVELSTYIYTKKQVPIFESSIDIRIDKQSVDKSIPQPWTTAPNLATEIQIIKSLSIMKKAVEKIEPLSVDLEKREQMAYRLARAYQQTTRVSQIEDTDIVTVRVYSDDAIKAQLLATAIVEVFVDEGVENRQKESKATLAFINEKLATLKTEVELFERELQKFSQNERVFEVSTSLKAALDRMSADQVFEFEDEMIRIQARVNELETIIQHKQAEGSLLFVRDKVLTDGFIFSGLRRRLLELEFDKFILLIDYTDDHPSVLQQQQVIDKVQVKLVSIISQYQQKTLNQDGADDIAMGVNWFMLQIKKEVLFRLINKFYNDKASLSPDQARYLELKRQLEHALESYNQVLGRQQQAELALASEIAKIDIVSPAFEAKRPIKPNEMQNYIVGSALGLLLGLMFAFILENLDMSIGNIDEFEKIFRLFILGIIPVIRLKGERLQGRDYSGKKGRRVQRQRESLATLLAPGSIEAESFVGLRTNMMNLMDARAHKSFLLTSAYGGEGKTTVAANLALSLAQLGEKTVIVDANLRRPTLHDLFGVERDCGLADVMMGRLSWQEAVKTPVDIVVSGSMYEKFLNMQGLGNVNIITCGRRTPNPSSLLSSKRFEKLIVELKHEFAFVVVVSAPVLAVSDALVIANKVDGVVLVCHLKKTKKRALKRAHMFLNTAKAHILGVAINQVPLKSTMGSWVQLYRQYGEYDETGEGARVSLF